MKNLFRLGFRFVAFASVLMAAFSTSAFAQEAAEAVAPQEQTMLDKWIIAGGWTMIPIMLVEAFIIFLVIYNMVALKKEKFCPEDLKVTLLQLMAECRIRSAIEVAAGSPTYLGRLVAYALPNVDATRPEDLGKDAIEDAVADFTANESRSVFKWINMLALCAQISPMLGLFGTLAVLWPVLLIYVAVMTALDKQLGTKMAGKTALAIGFIVFLSSLMYILKAPAA